MKRENPTGIALDRPHSRGLVFLRVAGETREKVERVCGRTQQVQPLCAIHFRISRWARTVDVASARCRPASATWSPRNDASAYGSIFQSRNCGNFGNFEREKNSKEILMNKPTQEAWKRDLRDRARAQSQDAGVGRRGRAERAAAGERERA